MFKRTSILDKMLSKCLYSREILAFSHYDYFPGIQAYKKAHILVAPVFVKKEVTSQSGNFLMNHPHSFQ